MSLLNIAISGLRTAQLAIGTAGHNVSNANTPGFSRQRVEVQTQPASGSGAGFIGQGARAVDIARIVDNFVIGQLRADTAASGQQQALLDGLGQVDNLLADERTGLSPALGAFFAALHAASNDPTSVPGRRLVLAQADALTARFQALFDRGMQLEQSTISQLRVSADRVSDLARGIADLNRAIELASGKAAGRTPNDLLDTRDRLLEELAEQVDVSVVEQEGRVNVFIGNGQSLVVGGQVNELVADAQTGDLRLRTQGGTFDATEALAGGRIGGLLRFRDHELHEVFNTLGRLALQVADAVNAQHVRGIDLAGNRGGLFFGDINAAHLTTERVQALDSTGTVAMGVRIVDAQALSLSDYEFSVAAPSASTFSVLRLADGAEVARGSMAAGPPLRVEFDGLALEIDDGAFSAGDRFLLRPTHFGARDIARRLDAPVELALAAPLAAEAGIGNAGSGRVTSATVLDIDSPAFAVPGQLQPPVAIVFTSPTTYDVLDATDPVALRPLSPPLSGLPFVPGVANDLLPALPGTTLLAGDGARAGALNASPVVATAAQLAAAPPGNGYLDDTLRVVATDPVTGIETTLPVVSVPADSSARATAAALNALPGVTARARTDVVLHSLVDDGGGLPPALLVDGVDVRLPAGATGLAALADAIAADPVLAARGIGARSDGERLLLSRSDGADLTVGLRGDGGDRITVEGRDGAVRVLQGAGAGTPAALAGSVDVSAGFDFSAGGPYTFLLSVDDRAPAMVTLAGTHASGGAVVAAVQAAVDAAAGAGRVAVSLTAGGALQFASTSVGPTATLAISGILAGAGAGAGLGLANAAVRGDAPYSAVSVGGTVAVQLAPGHALSALADSLFAPGQAALPAFLGYQVTIAGTPAEGDVFRIDHARGGSADNRNGLELAALESRPLLDGGKATLAEGYAELVQHVGGRTAGVRVDADAARGLVEHSRSLRNDISGVSLDEEAADLLRHQQAYTASARVVGIARDTFETLLQAFS
jgi:flagellar hook-associated protein 1 FlgK